MSNLLGFRFWIRAFSGVCFLCCGLSLFAEEVVIDDMSDVTVWKALSPPEASIAVVGGEADGTPVLHIQYDLGTKHTYGVVGRSIDLTLPENFELQFPIKGRAPRNNLEFKMVDGQGNTFLKVWRNFRVTTNTQVLRIPKRELRYGWGPNPKAVLDTIAHIEFAVVSGRGGKGDILVGPVTLTECEPGPPEQLPLVKASSIENPEHAPGDVVDQSFSTYWRSRPFDPQWIEVDFGEPREMAGLRMHWGLYGDYEVALSADNENWQTVYTMNHADGGTDELFFQTTTAQYLRVTTLKQACRDGYTLYEIEPLGVEEKPLVQASSSVDSCPADKIFDGNPETQWHSGQEDVASVTLDLRDMKPMGGVVIYWGDDFAVDYMMDISEDGVTWQTVYTATQQAGGIDRIHVNEFDAQYIRIQCQRSNHGKGYGIRQIELKAPEEAMTKTLFYQLAAAAHPGCYPRWLLNEQAYWTMVGTPEDVREAMLAEDGTLEPLKRGYTIMPLLRVNGTLLTRDDVDVKQSLLEGYLPIPSVEWAYDDLTLDITALAHGGAASSAYARYTLENHGTQSCTGQLYFVIHPIQVYPPWQFGHDGFSPITSMVYSNGVVMLNDDRPIFFLQEPDRFAAKGASYQVGAPVMGDVADDIIRGALPMETCADDPEGFVSGVAVHNFNLAPGESNVWHVAVPLHQVIPHLSPAMNRAAISKAFQDMLEQTAGYYKERVDRVTFDVPDEDLVNTLKANLSYNLITKDGPGFQPGSRSYDKAWMRDGSVAALALLKMGYTDEIRDFIEWFAAYQFDTGEIPPIIDNKHTVPLWEELYQNLQEFDSQGQFVHLVYEYYCYTGDQAFLEKMYPQVVKALQFLQHLREQRATDEYKNNPDKQEFYNILPPSRSHEGYYLAHSFWDDFWALKGWKDGAAIAAVLGDAADAQWMQDEYETLQAGVYHSIERVVQKYNINYVPGCADMGDFDATSTAAGIVFCDELDFMPQPLTSNTFDRFYTELSARFEDGAQYVYTPYEIRTVLAFLFMEQKERALNLLHFLLDCRRPPAWCHLAEVVHSDYRFPCYIGDMPHTWVGAGVINTIRGLFLYEDGNTLVIGAGIDPQWIQQDHPIHIANAPTRFGKMNIDITSDDHTVTVALTGDAAPPEGFIVVSPLGNPVSVDRVKQQNLPATVVFTYEVADGN